MGSASWWYGILCLIASSTTTGFVIGYAALTILIGR